jgi:transglutaminase/protease-like cytokinesis protein 3
MNDRIFIKLSEGDIMVIKAIVETFIAKRVYGYIYATRTGDSTTVPTLSETLNHMANTHAEVYKIHACIRDKMGMIQSIHTEDLAMNFYYKCVEMMRWRETHPEQAARDQESWRQHNNPTPGWVRPLPAEELEIPF